MKRCRLLSVAILLIACRAKAETLSVSAAISLKESLTDLRKVYEADSGDRIVFNFDASGKLAAQIEQGAPVDLFISADNPQMEKLAKSEGILPDTRRIVATNTLVLVTSADEKHPPKSFADLAVDRGSRIAIGEPTMVPAGRYAMQTLTALKLDQAVSTRLIFGQSVREVLTFVQRDEVCAGIVYGTDAQQAGDKVKVIATADESTHEEIEYPAAVIAGAAHAGSARRFLEFLSAEPARKIFKARGFSIPQTNTATTQKTRATAR